MPRSILPTRNMLTRDRLMTQKIGIASLCTCDNVASYVFSLFSFCSHGDRFRERLEWQHSPSGTVELRMIIPLTHLMWFSLNLSVFCHLFHCIIFSKIEKNIYNWFSWIIIVTNYVKYISSDMSFCSVTLSCWLIFSCGTII